MSLKTNNPLKNRGLFALIVVLPGLEPGQTGPESVVLPLHHKTLFLWCYKSKNNVNIRKIFIKNNTSLLK